MDFANEEIKFIVDPTQVPERSPAPAPIRRRKAISNDNELDEVQKKKKPMLPKWPDTQIAQNLGFFQDKKVILYV